MSRTSTWQLGGEPCTDLAVLCMEMATCHKRELLPDVGKVQDLQEAACSSHLLTARCGNLCAGRLSWLLPCSCLTWIYCCVLVDESVDIYCSDA